MKTSEFLRDLKLMTSEPDFSDEEILRVASLQLRNRVYPFLMKLNDGYYTRTETITVPYGADRVAMPVDGLSDSYTDVKLWLGEYNRELVRVQPSQVRRQDTGRPRGFYLMGRDMVFDCKADAEYKIRFIYTYMPPDLVLSKAAPLVQSMGDSFNLPRLSLYSFTLADLYSSGQSGVGYATIWRGDGSHERLATVSVGTINEAPTSSVGVTQSELDNVLRPLESEIVQGKSCYSLGMGSRFVAVPNTYRLLLMHLTAAALMRTIGDYEAAQVHKSEVDLLTQSSSVKGRQSQNHRLRRNVWY